MATGCYKIPALSFDLVEVFTNKMATDAYRGAGRPEATYMVERIVDIAAAEMKLDPAEIRAKNIVKSSEFPFTTPSGLIYDSGNYEACMTKALTLAKYKQLRAKQKQMRKRGENMRASACRPTWRYAALGPLPLTRPEAVGRAPRCALSLPAP